MERFQDKPLPSVVLDLVAGVEDLVGDLPGLGLDGLAVLDLPLVLLRALLALLLVSPLDHLLLLLLRSIHLLSQ